mmetsp:Transcript_32423/g.39877  ORF Transcript_32423/g.39877 Transcript_32423/m.39877 type:complete len:653 (-) Transcript_32423:204-2162(-)
MSELSGIMSRDVNLPRNHDTITGVYHSLPKGSVLMESSGKDESNATDDDISNETKIKDYSIHNLNKIHIKKKTTGDTITPITHNKFNSEYYVSTTHYNNNNDYVYTNDNNSIIAEEFEPNVITAMNSCCKSVSNYLWKFICCCMVDSKDDYQKMKNNIIKNDESNIDVQSLIPKHNTFVNNDISTSLVDIRGLNSLKRQPYNDVEVLKTHQKESKRNIRMTWFFCPCVEHKPYLWELVLYSILLQAIQLIVVGVHSDIFENKSVSGYKSFAIVITSILWVIQLIILTQIFTVTWYKLWEIKVSHICQIYITLLIVFGGFYTILDFWDKQSFNINNTEFANSQFAGRVIAFMYFSTSQQTLCGVSEISPKIYFADVFCAIQMMIGVLFNVIIISIAISRIGEDVTIEFIKQQRNELKHYTKTRGSSWYRFTHNETVTKMRRWFRSYLFPIIMILQGLKSLIEFEIDHDWFDTGKNYKNVLGFIVLDALAILIVIIVSVKFIHIGHINELSLSHLLQTYLSCVVVFVGIYCDVYTIGGTSSPPFKIGSKEKTSQYSYWDIFLHFCYFSFAVMTLCGSALNIRPTNWYACIPVILEMILGCFFHVFIFGIGLLHLATKKFRDMKLSHGNSKTNYTPGNDIDAPSAILSQLLRDKY